MKNKNGRTRVAAIGRTEYLEQSVRHLDKNGFAIALIITAATTPYRKAETAAFKSLARQLGSTFIETGNIHSQKVVSAIKRAEAEIAISVNWPTLIERKIIDAFPLGIINAHAGDLPRYRGNAAPNWAIINGEKEVVLTLHLMNEKLDAGPIILKKSLAINENTYIGEVYEFIGKNLPKMFLKAVRGLINQTITPQPQSADPCQSLRCYPRKPEDSRLLWNNDALPLNRIVHASAKPFAGAYAFHNNQKITIWRSHYEMPPYPFLGIPGQVAKRRKNGEVVVICGAGFLILEEVEIEGKRLKPSLIIRSARDRLD